MGAPRNLRIGRVQSTVRDPLIGRLVDGRYEVHARIARGGMATVYRALDRRLDRTVALKVMHPHLADSADFVARFRREARSAARLSHPGIVAIYDQGHGEDLSYLTMELVEGHNLRTELRRHGALPLGRALELVDGVLDAIACAHRAGVVHRDVKPENVLVQPDGRPTVTDFGLARAVTEATAASTGTVLGTVAYLAPEIVTSGTADTRADVYAAGIMLFELITEESGGRMATGYDEHALPRLRAAVERLTGLASETEGTDAGAVFADLRDRTCALLYWATTQRNTCAWVAGVHGYLGARSDDERAEHRAYVQEMIDLDLANTRALLELWETSETEFIVVSEVSETSFVYGENLGDHLRRKLDLTERYRDAEPHISTDILWRLT